MRCPRKWEQPLMLCFSTLGEVSAVLFVLSEASFVLRILVLRNCRKLRGTNPSPGEQKMTHLMLNYQIFKAFKLWMQVTMAITRRGLVAGAAFVALVMLMASSVDAKVTYGCSTTI
jgi:hypothetical protein